MKFFRRDCLVVVWSCLCLSGILPLAAQQTPAQQQQQQPVPPAKPPAQQQQTQPPPQRNPFETVPQTPTQQPAPATPPQQTPAQPAQPQQPPLQPVPQPKPPVAPPKPVPGRLEGQPVELIEFRGARRVPQDTLRAQIATRQGDLYSEETLRRDFMTLWNTGRFDDIRLETEPG